MSSRATSTTEIIRRTVLSLDPTAVLEVVDALDLRPSTKITAVVGVPLRSLQQRRDVAAFAAGAPLPAVAALLEVLAAGPLERVIAALGEHAETPDFDQLSAAVDQVAHEGATRDELVAVLGHAAGEGFPAAPHCRRLLEERPDFALTEMPSVSAPSRPLGREVDPAQRERRRARRAQQRRPATPPRRPRRAT